MTAETVDHFEMICGILLFAAVFIGLPITACVTVWREIARGRSVAVKASRLLILSAFLTSFNILLEIGLFALWFVTKGFSASPDLVGPQTALKLSLGGAIVGLFFSLLVILASLFCQPGLSRRLCIWLGSLGIPLFLAFMLGTAHVSRQIKVEHGGWHGLKSTLAMRLVRNCRTRGHV